MNNIPERIARIETRQKQIEEEIRLTKDLPNRIAKAIAFEISKIDLHLTQTVWAQPLRIDLGKERPHPELIGTYPQGGDCIVYVPGSTGTATFYLDNPAGFGYQLGTNCFKIRQPFREIYVENTAQSGSYIWIIIAKGDIDIERITMTGMDIQAQYTALIDSTTTPLSASGTYTSPSWIDVANYGFVSVMSSSDVAGTLYLQWSNDGTNLHYEEKVEATPLTLSDTTTVYYAIIKSDKPARYCRVHYVNSSSDQTKFSLYAYARVVR